MPSRPGETFTAFVISVVAGARRFAHSSLLRADRALHALLGMQRFPTDGTMRNLFKRFKQGLVVRFYEPLWAWQLARVPRREGGYSLDLDSTVFERYGKQEGVKKGYNPKKPGRGSHHPLLAVLGEAPFILHGWLRSGNTRADTGVVEFLKEALAKLESREWIRRCEPTQVFSPRSYCNTWRIAAGLHRGGASDALVKAGSGADLAVAGTGRDLRGGRVSLAVAGLGTRAALRGGAGADTGAQTFPGPQVVRSSRLYLSDFRDQLADPPEEIWRDYNQRACMEQRIEELKSDLAADDFCLKKFFATEAAFLSILMLFNLLSEFQRAVGMTGYRQPASLRVQVFLCGAILGRAGHRPVLHLSTAWGGLEKRNPFFDKLLLYEIPTSRKLELQLQGAV